MDFELDQRFFSKFEIQKAGYLENFMQLLEIHHCPNLNKEWSKVISTTTKNVFCIGW
jgi:hypothetical protein